MDESAAGEAARRTAAEEYAGVPIVTVGPDPDDVWRWGWE